MILIVRFIYAKTGKSTKSARANQGGPPDTLILMLAKNVDFFVKMLA